MDVSSQDHPHLFQPWSERPFGRGTTRSLGDLLTMVTNHLLTGMILQVVRGTVDESEIRRAPVEVGS